jgi:hypothetical protein
MTTISVRGAEKNGGSQKFLTPKNFETKGGSPPIFGEWLPVDEHYELMNFHDAIGSSV